MSGCGRDGHSLDPKRANKSFNWVVRLFLLLLLLRKPPFTFVPSCDGGMCSIYVHCLYPSRYLCTVLIIIICGALSLFLCIPKLPPCPTLCLHHSATHASITPSNFIKQAPFQGLLYYYTLTPSLRGVLWPHPELADVRLLRSKAVFVCSGSGVRVRQ